MLCLCSLGRAEGGCTYSSHWAFVSALLPDFLRAAQAGQSHPWIKQFRGHKHWLWVTSACLQVRGEGLYLEIRVERRFSHSAWFGLRFRHNEGKNGASFAVFSVPSFPVSAESSVLARREQRLSYPCLAPWNKTPGMQKKGLYDLILFTGLSFFWVVFTVPCLVASCFITDVFWFWNWPFQSFFGGASHHTTSDPDLGEIPPLLLSRTPQASCWYCWLKSSKGTMRKLELLMPLSFHIRVIICSWGTAQPESLIDCTAGQACKNSGKDPGLHGNKAWEREYVTFAWTWPVIQVLGSSLESVQVCYKSYCAEW